jgi:hypothetical protein
MTDSEYRNSKVYSGPKQDFYRVWKREDGSLLIEVLHNNNQWRNRLLDKDPQVKALPGDVLSGSKNNIRAAVFLLKVIQEHPDAFRAGTVTFTSNFKQQGTSFNPEVREKDTVEAMPTTSRPAVPIEVVVPAVALDPLVGRDFFYRQIYRLLPAKAEDLSVAAGLYMVLERGQVLGRPIEGLPIDTLRCVKVGMTNRCMRDRIHDEYFGSNQREAAPRRHVGDALIGQALKHSQSFAGFAPEFLSGVRALWNAGTSPSEAISCKRDLARKFNLDASSDLRKFETSIEQEVTNYMHRFLFIAIGACSEDIWEIEDRANSLLRDVAEVDFSEVDPSSLEWLGSYSSREAIQKYGLWAVKGVTRKYRPYVEHSSKRGGADDQGRPIADWLVRLRELVDRQVEVGP